MEINNFNIADFDIQIAFRNTTVNGMHLLSSFKPSSRTSTGATAVCCSATRTLQTAAVRSTAAGICASSD